MSEEIMKSTIQQFYPDKFHPVGLDIVYRKNSPSKKCHLSAAMAAIHVSGIVLRFLDPGRFVVIFKIQANILIQTALITF